MPAYDNTLEEIKDRLDIVDFISSYVHLKKTGQNWKGLCPFHSEKTPSFNVSPAKQIFHCFGCGSGGDIFTFLIRYENLTFPEAMRVLAQRAGVALKVSQKQTVIAGEKESLLNVHSVALNFFQQHLLKNALARDYLKSRGINHDIQKLFALGYAPKSWDALHSYLKRKGFKAETIKKSGLVSRGTKGHYDTFRDRIIFPIYDLKGDVIAFGGRSVNGAEPKYLNSPETSIFNKRRVLYGLNLAKNAIKETGCALFMEGYLDVITAHIYGFLNAVAPLGTAFTREHGKLIKRFTENIILIFDSDQAGIKAAKNAANIMLEEGLNVRVLSMPDNEDPDSFIRKNDRDSFSKLLEHPLSIVEFHMQQRGDRRLMAREAMESISRVQDKVLQGYYVKMLSEKLAINEFFIIEELKKIKDRAQSGHKSTARETLKAIKARPLDEVYIIKLLLQLTEKTEEVRDILSEYDFKDNAVRGVFKKIMEGFFDFNELIIRCEEEEKNLLAEISLRDDFDNPEKVFEDCVRRLKNNRRKILLQDIQARIEEAEAKKDFNLLKKLQEEQHNILKSQIS